MIVIDFGIFYFKDDQSVLFPVKVSKDFFLDFFKLLIFRFLFPFLFELIISLI